MESNLSNTYTSKFLKFFIPSLLGILLFMIPVKNGQGEITIIVAILSNLLTAALGESLLYILTAIICTSALLSLLAKLLKPDFIINNEILNSAFNTSWIWLTIRVLGAAFSAGALIKFGPEFIWSENTGGFVLNELLTVLFSIFFFAGLLLPLLLNFGLLEFCGVLLTKIMRPLFKLPGRSSIDCITSWLGDGTLGVMLTSRQYEDGFYSEREAAVISTTFSAVSITFSLVVISQVGLTRLFVPFYITVTIAGIAAAIIIPRIPPLSRIPDSYYEGMENRNKEIIPEGHSSFSWALNSALERAHENSNIKGFFKEGLKNVLDMWLTVLPVVMGMATLALIIAEYTPVFEILGMPFIPILNLFHVPEAAAAAQTLIVGFADMLLPSVIAAGTITNEMTKFIVACVSVTQLIYMSEVGGVLLGSKIPISLKNLIIIFIERTLITLPVIVLMANIIF